MTTRRTDRGFSLVELVTVIAIFAIVAAIATPMIMQWIPNKRLKAATNDIVSAVVQAKAEAIRRGERVTLVFDYQAGQGGAPANARLTEKQLFVMFTDNGLGPMDANGDRTVCNGCTEHDALCAEGEEIIMNSGPAPHRVAIRENTFLDSALAFNERGLPINAKNGRLLNKANNQDRKVRLCLEGRNVNCREVSVTPTGGVRTQLAN